jgi:hypothetical protein
MKIAIAVHHFPPRYTSGAELRAYRTASWLRDHGHDVHVICVEAIDSGNGNGLTFEDDTYDGLPVRRLSFPIHSVGLMTIPGLVNTCVGIYLNLHQIFCILSVVI